MALSFWRAKKPWTNIGEGIDLDHPQKIVKIGLPDSHRKGHFWCFGTTRIGKTRMMEWIIEQDIRKGNSVVCIDPKGDIELFSKIAFSFFLVCVFNSTVLFFFLIIFRGFFLICGDWEFTEKLRDVCVLIDFRLFHCDGGVCFQFRIDCDRRIHNGGD